MLRVPSISFHNKKASYIMDCYISHTALLVFILLFIIGIIYYYFETHRSKRKNIGTLTI